MKRKCLPILFFLFLIDGMAQGVDSLRINPNPFNTSVIVNYYLANSDTATLEVFNNVGSTVKIFYADSFVLAGSHSLNYNTTFLSNGAYYFSLRTKTDTVNKVGIKNTSTSVVFFEKPIISVSPNPASVHLSIRGIDADNFEKAILSIKNTFGQSVMEIPMVETVSVLDLPQGCYSIQILVANESIYSTKFIKL